MTTQSTLADCYNAFSGWGGALGAAHRERVAKTIALVPAGVRTILDVGCGDGAVSNPLVERGFDVTGVDFSSVALRSVAAKKVVAGVGRLPFEGCSFDVVICAEVLEHLPEGTYERALREIQRVARQYIIVTTPNEEHFPSAFVKCGRCGHVYHSSHHVRVFDKAAHGALFGQFELERTVEIRHRKFRPLRTWLRQHLLGFYRARAALPCPRCRHEGPEEPALGLLGKVLLKGIRLLGKLQRPRRSARWIASLYRSRRAPRS